MAWWAVVVGSATRDLSGGGRVVIERTLSPRPDKPDRASLIGLHLGKLPRMKHRPRT